ncbi:hypothetical protein PMAYCL1PPCAC_03771, partial [Pristionchus mayeri]
SQMSIAEFSLLDPEDRESRAGDAGPAISGSRSIVERLSTFCLPIKVVAFSYLLIMFISCFLAFPFVVEYFSQSYKAPYVAVLCFLPIPFLIVGFVAVRKEHLGMATVFEGYMVFLTVITLLFWSLLTIRMVHFYLS